MILAGYASRYNRPHAYSGRIESLQAGCFAKVLSGAHVRFLLDHDDRQALTCTDHGLRLWSDATGLAFKARLPNTPAGRSAFAEVLHGRMNGMSARTRNHVVIRSYTGADWISVITSADLVEISLVPRGLVPGTFAMWLPGQEPLDRPFRLTAAQADEAAGRCRFRQDYWGR